MQTRSSAQRESLPAWLFLAQNDTRSNVCGTLSAIGEVSDHVRDVALLPEHPRKPSQSASVTFGASRMATNGPSPTERDDEARPLIGLVSESSKFRPFDIPKPLSSLRVHEISNVLFFPRRETATAKTIKFETFDFPKWV